ncbi:MAG: M50 family metallopeptidase [Saprospiraceae bacterium]|nr:M50 family metallopeptidase [Pyrinomonadaceae bacterium]
MRYTIAEEARPQVNLLIFATIVSLGLWVISWYIPLTSYIVYPLQLFATFVHEGSHVLATVLTGNTVQSLTVSPDTSGVVWSESSGWFSQLLISSAGYLGTTAFGAGLLAWIRFGHSSRIALYSSAGFVAVMTVIFGAFRPLWNFLANVTFGSIIFTVFSGTLLTAGLAAIARYANLKWVNFAVAFLAVQCLLNAVFSLLDLFFISATTNMQSDAANMAAATGIPSLFWVFIWMGISILMISVGLRVYAVTRKPAASDSVFED